MAYPMCTHQIHTV